MRKHWITKPLRLFSGAPQIETFRELPSIFPVRVLRRSDAPSAFELGASFELPGGHVFAGQRRDTTAFLDETDTVGLIVLQEGRCRYERYWHDVDASLQWPTWSVIKSFISALVGIAIHEGAIASIDDMVTTYVPALNGSAYDGASIRAVLQMSSGARWDEDYSNPESDLRRRGAAMAGGSYDEVAYNQYVYVDARRQVVIAKISANRNWGRSYDEAGYRDAQHMALFRAIAAAIC